MMEEGIMMGHMLSATRIWVDLAKVEVIMNFPTPKTLTHAHIFIGYVTYYRKSIENFSNKAFPLFQFLPKYVEFLWTYECEVVFKEIKELVCKAPYYEALTGSSHFIYLHMLLK